MLNNLLLISDVVLIEGQAPGGSIVGISPGINLTASTGGGGGSIVGITPGAALERKSVKDLAAGLNRLGGMDKENESALSQRKRILFC